MSTDLRRLRYERTATSNAVKRTIAHNLKGEAKIGLDGLPVPEPLRYVGALPSWWPFWSDVLKENVRKAVRAARALDVAERADCCPYCGANLHPCKCPDSLAD
jgi:hypothetical protein